MDTCLCTRHLLERNGKQPRSGLELGLPIPFLRAITITLNATPGSDNEK